MPTSPEPALTNPRFPTLAQIGSWLLWGAFVFISYWLYGYRPIAALPFSGVDDGLYLRHAEAFVNWITGHNPRWLGDYDYFLLAKAPLYGIFLGVLNLLCVPVRIGEFVLLIGLPLVFAAACRPAIVLRGWRLLAPAILLVWLPLLPSETHLLRNGFQSILTSYLVIASIGLLVHVRSGLAAELRWAALLGAVFSLCYLNREEAAWLGLVVVFSGGLFFILSWLHRSFSWVRIVLVAVVLATCAAPPILVVSTLNYRGYGVFLTTFRRSTAFTAAFQRMTSLEPDLRKRYIPIAHDTRYRAYELSPTFAKLKPFLEGNGSYWVAGNEQHSLFNGYDPKQNDFFISNYEFALEYAAWCSGAYTAPAADQLFAAIDRELGEAVRTGKIRAGAHGPATLAAYQQGDALRLVKAWWESLHGVLALMRADLDWSAQSVGDAPALDKVSRFVHSSLVPEDPAGMPYQSRRWLIGGINKVLSLVYWLTVPLLLVFCALTYRRSRAAFLQLTIIAAVPLVAVTMVCVAMAVVDTLGFRFLASMGYNVLAYSPFSVLSAFTIVVVLAYFRVPAGQIRSA